MAKRKKIGELLIESGLIGEVELNAGLHEQKSSKEKIGQALVRMGALASEDLAKILAKICGLPAVDINRVKLDKEAVHFVDEQFCFRHILIPLQLSRSKTEII